MTALAPRSVVSTIISETARRHGLTIENLFERRGGQPVERARMAAMWASREVLGEFERGSYTSLARLFHRHHTTIMSGVRRAHYLRQREPAFRRMSDDLVQFVDPGRQTSLDPE